MLMVTSSFSGPWWSLPKGVLFTGYQDIHSPNFDSPLVDDMIFSQPSGARQVPPQARGTLSRLPKGSPQLSGSSSFVFGGLFSSTRNLLKVGLIAATKPFRARKMRCSFHRRSSRLQRCNKLGSRWSKPEVLLASAQPPFTRGSHFPAPSAVQFQ